MHTRKQATRRPLAALLGIEATSADRGEAAELRQRAGLTHPGGRALGRDPGKVDV